MYGFKYWIIGKEMNQLLGDEDETDNSELGTYWNEKRYKTFNNIGIVTNLFFCAVLASIRAEANV